MLTDEFGRQISEVRISVTDRCNLDCVYCHNEGLGDTRGPMAPQEGELTPPELQRILEVLAEFDIQAVKYTGGEPMLRSDLIEIIERTPDSMTASMTTNGSLLAGYAQELAAAGLERINISQDAVTPDQFTALTNSGAFQKVLDGVEAALNADLTPVKLNMVVFDRTVDQIPAMIDRAGETDGLHLQLIEYMPELAGNPEWAVDIDDVHTWLAERADRVDTREMHDRDLYHIDGTQVEIVDPVGNPAFCANCRRLRITPEGDIKGCLNRPSRHSMDDLTKPEIRDTIKRAVAERVPYYGEYLVESEDGDWEINPRYLESAPTQ